MRLRNSFFTFLLVILTISCTFYPRIQKSVSRDISSNSTNANLTPPHDSFSNKLFTGYQAWFHTPGDGANIGWRHWGHNSSGNSYGELTVEMLPDVSEYPQKTLVKTDMVSASTGNPIHLFSSYHQETIDLHLKWMKDYKIDGLFLQWFITDSFDVRLEVAKRVKKAAEKHNRLFSVMIDISGSSNIPECSSGDGVINCVKHRWKSLVDSGVTSSHLYTRYKGRPLIAIWGVGFTHNANLNYRDAERLIDWFHNDAEDKYKASVLGGVPAYWRTLKNDSLGDRGWEHTYRKLDIISPWTVGRYNSYDSISSFMEKVVSDDIKVTNSNGQKYLPVVFPGFSWYNLQKTRGQNFGKNEIPRDGGQFLWSQIRPLAKKGVRSAYIAMFDEVDEGTAIFKVVAKKEDTPTNKFFLPLDADGLSLPSDWYLQVARYISEVFQGSKSYDSKTLPILHGNTAPQVPQQDPSKGCTKIKGDRLRPDEFLTRGECLISENGATVLLMQNDGNLVFYSDADRRVLWASNTNSANKLLNQRDGNLVLYTQNGKPVWYSGTAGLGDSDLVAQNDHNLVLYNHVGATWSSDGGRLVLPGSQPAPTPAPAPAPAPKPTPTASNKPSNGCDRIVGSTLNAGAG